MTISGSGSGTFQIKAEPNTGTTPRSADITFTNASGLSYDATFWEVEERLVPHVTEWFPPGEGETVQIYVESNVDWTVSKDDNIGWITLTKREGYFDITVDPNDTGQTRTTNIRLKGQYREKPVEIEVTQAGKKAWKGKPIPPLTGDLRTDIVNVARSQEGVTEEDGIEDKNPYSEEIRGKNYALGAWCGDFVAWVFKNASPNKLAEYVVYGGGYPDTVGLGEGWNVSWVPNWLRKAPDRWEFYPAPKDGDEQTIDVRIGDVAVWSDPAEGRGHVAIVVHVDSAKGEINFIGGNQGDSVREDPPRLSIKPYYSGQTFKGYVRLIPLTKVE